MHVNLYNKRKMKKTKKILDYIVYTGSGLEIIIAVIIFSTHFGLQDPNFLLLPVNYAIAVIVVLTGVVGSLFLWIKHYEKILFNLAMMRTRAINTFDVINNINTMPLPEPKIRYSYHHGGFKKFGSFITLKNIFLKQINKIKLSSY